MIKNFLNLKQPLAIKILLYAEEFHKEPKK